MRALAQGALVFSNIAMLPSVFLCMRLALRHLRPPNASGGGCPVCDAEGPEGFLQEQPRGLLGLWHKHSCCLLHVIRGFVYFNACESPSTLQLHSITMQLHSERLSASPSSSVQSNKGPQNISLVLLTWAWPLRFASGSFETACIRYAEERSLLLAFDLFVVVLWSVLYHACVDASTPFFLEAPTLQSLDFLFSYCALFVTALALCGIRSHIAEIVSLAGGLSLLGTLWLPETLESKSAALFVVACFSIPVMSLALRATAVWRRSRRCDELQQQEQLKDQWGEWRADDIKWLDGPVPSETETDASKPCDFQSRHQDLQRLLKQRMEASREAVCLAALGQAIARLETANRLRVSLCCSNSPPSLSVYRSFLECMSPLWSCMCARNDSFPQQQQQQAPTSEGPSQLQTSSSSSLPSKKPLSWAACLGIALTHIASRLELLGLGLSLAGFGTTKSQLLP